MKLLRPPLPRRFPARARSWALSLGVAALLGLSAAPIAAQTADARPTQVISANPFGLLLELFNAEYERAIGGSATAGIGGSFMGRDDADYLNLDAFWRFYPQGTPFDGWAFGAKVGVTQVASSSNLGFGFDVNRSWLLGANENFYVGLGFGLKRIFASDDAAFDLRYIPTFRIVNIGFAF
jgi:hypothetical protein